jgi:GxxExxY protein
MNTNKTDKRKYGNTLLYKEEVFQIVGATMEVHNQLGPGFLEAVYQEALDIELAARNIPFLAQQEIPIRYKGNLLAKKYIADFTAFEKIIIEIKSVHELSSVDSAQVINYLKASGYELGLLINFGATSLEWQRLLCT